METKTHEIKETAWPARTFIIKKDKLPFDQLSRFFGEQYGAIYGALGKMGIAATHAPYAFYYSVDEANKVTELAAAVQVDDADVSLPGFETVTLPAAKVITTRHTGSYETMRPAYQELDDYAREKGLQKGLVMEQYLSDPTVEKDPSNWKTDIFFLVK